MVEWVRFPALAEKVQGSIPQLEIVLLACHYENGLIQLVLVAFVETIVK